MATAAKKTARRKPAAKRTAAASNGKPKTPKGRANAAAREADLAALVKGLEGLPADEKFNGAGALVRAVFPGRSKETNIKTQIRAQDVLRGAGGGVGHGGRYTDVTPGKFLAAHVAWTAARS